MKWLYADNESATITPFALTQSKQKFNEHVKQWLRDVPQTSGVDNKTKTVVPEESGIGNETKTAPCDDNQATNAHIEIDFYKNVHDNSSTITSENSKTRASLTFSKISIQGMQAQERLKIAHLQASQFDELAEVENTQFELELELMHRKNELKQQIKKCKALCKLELASVQYEVWSETGSVKSFKRDTTPRPKIEIPFIIRNAEQNTNSTCLVKEKPCNLFKLDIQTDTAGPPTAVPKADAVKLANFPQANNSAITNKKASSSLLTAKAPEFRPGASSVLLKNRVNLSTKLKDGVEPESNLFVNYKHQSFPATTFPFLW